jgi:hypothetical protein
MTPLYTGRTQKNGAVSKVNKASAHHSFVYALYLLYDLREKGHYYITLKSHKLSL